MHVYVDRDTRRPGGVARGDLRAALEPLDRYAVQRDSRSFSGSSINLLNGVSVGLLLFMLSAGLTLIFSMLGVLNFAHASFYMLGAYVGYALAAHGGFWFALVVGAADRRRDRRGCSSACCCAACMRAARSPNCC